MTTDNNNNKCYVGNNNNQPNRRLFLSHLIQLISRWMDVIEMVQVAEPMALKNVNLEAFALMAYAAQQQDGFLLSNTIVKFSDYINENLHVVYCKPVVKKLINESQQLAQQVLSQATSPALSIHSLFANQSNYLNDQPSMRLTFC